MINRFATVSLLWLCTMTKSLYASERPNIIYILVDDMGYGDVAALNEDCKIKTPHIDAMAAKGVSFTDAHSTSSVSTPTRYGCLTGRYNWRSTLKSGVVIGYDNAFIPQDRTLLSTVLKRADYQTAFIGKWHLGWDWDKKSENGIEDFTFGLDSKTVKVDFNTPVGNGPNSKGFDYSYGFCGSLDMAPYVYVENGKATSIPTKQTEDKNSFWRLGLTSDDFVHEKCTEHLTDKALDYISEASSEQNPFFLYLPLPSPHTPILPTEQWAGKSELNAYADFVMLVDHQVGRIMNHLEQLGIDDNTVVLFTSDNGCSRTAKFEQLHPKGHYPNYIFRGMKSDIFEGGHHVPCIVQWGEKLEGGTKSDQLVVLTDFFATFAQLAGAEFYDNEGEDSYSLVSTLTSGGESGRRSAVHHSIRGEFAIRSGDWKLLMTSTSGGWSDPSPKDATQAGLPSCQLYNLKSDPSESQNLVEKYPERASALEAELMQIIREGRSTQGVAQSNENMTAKQWPQLYKIFPQLFSENK